MPRSRARIGRRLSRSVLKRAVRWTTATLNAQILGPSNQTFFDALGGLTLADKNEIRRVVRVHLSFGYSSDVGGNHVFGRFGLIVANDDAIVAGAVPDPVNDSGDSWMMNDIFHTEIDNLQQKQEIKHDIRASRLIPSGKSLVFVLDTDAAQVGNLHWHVGMRLLLEHR